MGEAADGLSPSLPPCENEEACGEARERNGLNRGERKEGRRWNGRGQSWEEKMERGMRIGVTCIDRDDEVKEEVGKGCGNEKREEEKNASEIKKNMKGRERGRNKIEKKKIT